MTAIGGLLGETKSQINTAMKSLTFILFFGRRKEKTLIKTHGKLFRLRNNIILTLMRESNLGWTNETTVPAG